MSVAIYPRPVYVVGPTASGKSAFALALAKKIGGVIISCDSMQIYAGLDVGTAKASAAERAEVEHFMVDIVRCDAEFSVAEYAAAAGKHIADALNRDKTPIIVGGTGLYVEALLYPLSFAGAQKSQSLRSDLEAEAAERGNEYLLERLRELDPVTADKLHKNDLKRIVRALEIVLTTGRTKGESRDSRPEINPIMVAFDTERGALYEKINRRVEKMLEDGLVAEVAAVGNFGCQSMQAIGYKEFSGCEFSTDSDGKLVVKQEELEMVAEKIKKNTRNYAKRQLTWFRRYPFAKWFDCDDTASAEAYIISRLSRPAD